MGTPQGTASPQHESFFSGITGGISATLSLFLYAFAALSARQALTLAEVLHRPLVDGQAYFWQTPGFDLNAFDTAQKNGQLAVVIGTVFLLIAFVTVALGGLWTHLTRSRSHRILTVWGVLLGILGLPLLIISMIWLWQAYLVQYLWPFS